VPNLAFGLDLDALEEAVFTETCKGSNCSKDCDDKLKRRIGRDLPKDADVCHASEQYRLLEKNLYRTASGEIKVLKKAAVASKQAESIKLQKLQQQDVSDKTSPYMIDLETKFDPNKEKVNFEPRYNNVSEPAQNVGRQLEPKVAEGDLELGCRAFNTFGHRGGPGEPENSIPAVLAGLNSGHNGLEIDAQRLVDGTWVVHHDPMIGRSSYGAKGLVSKLTREEWNQVRLFDPSGKKTDVKPPLLLDLLQVFSKKSIKGQVINIEIKMLREGEYNSSQLAQLDALVKSVLKPDQFLYTSTVLSALRAMRTVNPKVYLGLVIEPNPASLDRVINTTYGAEYRSVDTILPKSLQLKLTKKRENNREWLGRQSYIELEELIGPRFGLHIDYRDIDTIVEKVEAADIPWMVYELNDDDGLLKAIKLRVKQHQQLPKAVIVDSPRQMFCSVS